MNLLSMLSLLIFIIYISIGIYAFRTLVNSAERFWFVFLCTNLAIWSLEYLFVYNEISHTELWMKLAAFGWCLVSATLLNLVLAVTNNKLFNNSLSKGALYLPALVLLYMRVCFSWPLAYSDITFYKVFVIIDILYNISYQSISLLLIFMWSAKLSSATERRQAKVIIGAAIISFALNFLANAKALPPLSQFYALIMILGIYYAMEKYNFFKISSEILVNEMLSEMMDLFFLVSPTGRIIKVNSHTTKLLGYTGEVLSQMQLRELITDSEMMDIILSSEEQQSLPIYKEVYCKDIAGNNIPISLSISKILDKWTKKITGIIIIGQDITVKKQLEYQLNMQRETEENLSKSEERFKLMFNKHSAIMLIFDPISLKIVSANEAAQKFYGYSETDFIKMEINHISVGKNIEIKEFLTKVLENTEEVLFLKHKLSNQEVREVEIHATPISWGNKKMIFLVIHDITERKKEEESIRYLAYHDTLTGLANRKCFTEILENIIADAGHSEYKFAIIYIDLDEFKAVNDTYGHEMGDYILCEVSKKISICLSKKDVLARLAGDEFVLLIPDIAHPSDAYLIIEKISKVLKEPIRRGNHQLVMHASMGISFFPEEGITIDELLNTADKRMYRMKHNR